MGTIGKASILFRSDINDRMIRLSGSPYQRKLNFGTSWTTLRVGVRIRCETGEANGLTWGDGLTPRFGLGLCASAGAAVSRAAAGHWVGALTTGAVWTVQNQGAGDWILTFPTMAPAKKAGANFTVGTNFAANVAIGAGGGDTVGGPPVHHVLIFVDITKGSPNYSLRLFSTASPHTSGNNSRAQFLTQMEAATPALGGYTFQAAQTVAVDEGVNGVLDSICIFNELSIEMEILDHGLARLS